MNPGPLIDGVLVQWGERLFYPRTRMVKVAPPPHLAEGALHHHAGHIRQRIEATMLRRAPQVMVKVTGGGRGMAAIAAHFRYIAKQGRLPFEDDRGVVRESKDALRDLADQRRHGGSHIDETNPRREAFSIMLSMPAGTDPLIVQKAAREFAQTELADHRYVMVLHDHQANPHVHLSVRAESKHGKRLNPRKADLHRWRETFADKLRGWGVEAEATRQATRGEQRRYATLWQVKAEQEGRFHKPHAESKSGDKAKVNRTQAMLAWAHVTQALAGSDQPENKKLAEAIVRHVRQMPHFVEAHRARQREQGGQRELPGVSPVQIDPRTSARSGPEIQR